MTWRTDGKLKPSKRKPLSDVSNSVTKKASKKSAVKLSFFKKMKPKNQEININNNKNVNVDPLHRLLSVHSDVSSLLRQIDEVVVEAFKVEIDDEKSEEINSFTDVLSEIQSSLKPWILRLQKALAAPSTDSDVQLGENSVKALNLNKNDENEANTPEPTTQPSLISPSPLVSCRATDFTADVGKQLFLLTPLPTPRPSTSKPPASVKPISRKPENVITTLESTSELEFLSPLKTSEVDQFSLRKIDRFHKSTPFPVGHQRLYDSSDSESSGGEVPEKLKLGLKYPELIGIKPSRTMINERKVLEESPAWLRSPPKCCTLMEPLDEKTVKHDPPLNDRLQKLTTSFNLQMSLGPKQSNICIGNQDKGNTKGNLMMAECTPMWKGPESVLRTGGRPRPGENTLKRELWTRFEAASTTDDFEFNFPETPHKGFLDKLDEAS